MIDPNSLKNTLTGTPNSRLLLFIDVMMSELKAEVKARWLMKHIGPYKTSILMIYDGCCRINAVLFCKISSSDPNLTEV